MSGFQKDKEREQVFLVSVVKMLLRREVLVQVVKVLLRERVLQDKSSNSFILFVQALSQIQSEIVTESEIA